MVKRSRYDVKNPPTHNMEDLEGINPGEMSFKTLAKAVRRKQLKKEIFTYITTVEVLLDYLKLGLNQETLKKAFIHFIENDKHTFIPHIAKYFNIPAFLRSDVYGKHGYFFLFSGISTEMMKALLQNGYSAGGDLEIGKRTIFAYVCVVYPQFIRIFLENGADVNNSYDDYPVGFHVVSKCNEENIRTIVEFGFDLSSRSNYGTSVYSLNLISPCYKTFDLLRSLGAPVETDILEKLKGYHHWHKGEKMQTLVNYFAGLLEEQQTNKSS